MYSDEDITEFFSFYPGWRMRIYHNVTSDQTLVKYLILVIWIVFLDYNQVLNRLCKLYCTFDHVDFCDTRQYSIDCIKDPLNDILRALPSTGNLNEDFPVGRFWRFQALGDPTVRLHLIQKILTLFEF